MLALRCNRCGREGGSKQGAGDRGSEGGMEGGCQRRDDCWFCQQAAVLNVACACGVTTCVAHGVRHHRDSFPAQISVGCSTRCESCFSTCTHLLHMVSGQCKALSSRPTLTIGSCITRLLCVLLAGWLQPCWHTCRPASPAEAAAQSGTAEGTRHARPGECAGGVGVDSALAAWLYMCCSYAA